MRSLAAIIPAHVMSGALQRHDRAFQVACAHQHVIGIEGRERKDAHAGLGQWGRERRQHAGQREIETPAAPLPRCPAGQAVTAGTFPAAVPSWTPYGPRLRALALAVSLSCPILSQAQFVPLGRGRAAAARGGRRGGGAAGTRHAGEWDPSRVARTLAPGEARVKEGGAGPWAGRPKWSSLLVPSLQPSPDLLPFLSS